MAKAIGLVFALCILGIAAAVHGHQHDVFHVEGDVYCDPCRVKFVTEISQKLTGATVRLECRNLDTKKVTYSVEGLTGADSHYSLQVIGDHQYDTCEVSVIKSPRKDCREPMGEFAKSRIVCTENSGIHAPVRYANPIGFMTKAAVPQCAPILFDMGILTQ